MKTWLEWQASQLSTPAWWLELRATLGMNNQQKLACKIGASFSIPEDRMRTIPGQGYPVPPTPKWLNRNAFLLDDLSYQDIWLQFVLLTIAYARGLQYWAEKCNLLESPGSHPLIGGVVELRGAVREYITFTNWDFLWGLGAVYPGATNQQPQTNLFSWVLSLLGNESSGLDTGFMEATTQSVPPAGADVDTARCTVPASGMERENHYLLVLEEIHSETHWWLLFYLDQPGQSVMRCHHEGIEVVRWKMDMV